MNHLRGNAIQAGHVQNPYCVIKGLHNPSSQAKFQHYRNTVQKCGLKSLKIAKKFEFLVKNLPLRDKSP